MPKKRSVSRLLIMLAAAVVLAATLAFVFRGEIRFYINRNYTEVRVVNGSNWFDYPVGAPNARGYYKAQNFGGNAHHLGEDWNGVGGGNSDYGDPVYAVADGVVSCAEDAGGGWGNVARIIHPVKRGVSVEAIYAHLAKVNVQFGAKVARGQIIGTIGDAGGYYPAHLHFEIRKQPGLALGNGYGENPNNQFLNPTEFIDKHRKKLKAEDRYMAQLSGYSFPYANISWIPAFAGMTCSARQWHEARRNYRSPSGVEGIDI